MIQYTAYNFILNFMKNKNLIIAIFIGFLLIILAIITIKIVIPKFTKTETTKENSDSITQNDSSNNESYEYDQYEEELFAQEEHNLKLEIISPEEETFIPRQARMYNALISGNGKYATTANCHWDFYLNENNQETLYKQMDNTAIVSGESKEICGFTSTFIESRGELRVVLTVTIYNAVNPNLETISAERKYIVQ